MTTDGWAVAPTRRLLIAGFACVLLGSAAVLFWVIPSGQIELSTYYGVGFADDYDDLAISLVNGHGYRFSPDTAPTMMREPGYPVFLAAIFSVFGHNLTAVRVANLMLALASALLLMHLARRVSGSPFVAAVAPLLFLAHPGVIVAESRGGVEILFILFLIAFMILYDAALRSGRTWTYLAAGAVLGAAILIRSTPILFPLFLGAHAAFSGAGGGPRWGRIGRMALLGVAALLVMTPWIVRNYRLVGRLVPTATVQGVAAHAGQQICKNLSFDRSFQQLDTAAGLERARLAASMGYRFRGGYYQYFFSSRDEYAFNGQLLSRVIGEYRDRPLLLAKCASANLLFNFWFAGKNWSVTAFNVLVQLPYLLLAAAGAYGLRKRGHLGRAVPIALLIVYLAGVHAPILAQARYSVPAVPFLSIFAAAALAPLVSRWRAAKIA